MDKKTFEALALIEELAYESGIQNGDKELENAIKLMEDLIAKGNKEEKEPKYLDKEEDRYALADYLDYYLSETMESVRKWDTEHLAMNMLGELDIVKPKWWDKRLKQ